MNCAVLWQIWFDAFWFMFIFIACLLLQCYKHSTQNFLEFRNSETMLKANRRQTEYSVRFMFMEKNAHSKQVRKRKLSRKYPMQHSFGILRIRYIYIYVLYVENFPVFASFFSWKKYISIWQIHHCHSLSKLCTRVQSKYWIEMKQTTTNVSYWNMKI